jgi:hypothetical protein
MKSILTILTTVICLGGCSFLKSTTPPRSPGETVSGYNYIPIDPLSVTIDSSCKAENANVLSSLPDNAIRMLMQKFNLNGNVNYGSVLKTSGEGELFVITIDYINSDTIQVPMCIKKTMNITNRNPKTKERIRHSWSRKQVDLFETHVDSLKGSEIYEISKFDQSNPPTERCTKTKNIDCCVRVDIPVYIGVGLRVTVNFRTLQAKASISGLGKIGMDVASKKLSGTVFVQTLGLNSKSISTIIPVQSDLNDSTIQNAIVSISTIKALIYSDETVITPRVVGFYLPFPADKTIVNEILSQLLTAPIVWNVPCKAKVVNK